MSTGGCSSLPGEVGKRVRGLELPSGEAGKRAQVGACVLVGVCTSTYVVRCFLYNKILKTETTAVAVFSQIGFPP